MTRPERPKDDRREQPAIRTAKSMSDDSHDGAFASAEPWWSQARLTTRKTSDAPSRSRQRRRHSSQGDGSPPLGPLKIPTPRRIGGSLLLAVGYSLLVWAALFVIADVLADIM